MPAAQVVGPQIAAARGDPDLLSEELCVLGSWVADRRRILVLDDDRLVAALPHPAQALPPCADHALHRVDHAHRGAVANVLLVTVHLGHVGAEHGVVPIYLGAIFVQQHLGRRADDRARAVAQTAHLLVVRQLLEELLAPCWGPIIHAQLRAHVVERTVRRLERPGPDNRGHVLVERVLERLPGRLPAASGGDSPGDGLARARSGGHQRGLRHSNTSGHNRVAPRPRRARASSLVELLRTREREREVASRVHRDPKRGSNDSKCSARRCVARRRSRRYVVARGPRSCDGPLQSFRRQK
mmetsp:Transcript_48463/g.113382  ORF Transcript_48463/g.113382 Transcript_48463/m.113382 type:complete len:298 (+) Transcript_48463:632-1525(+)